MTTIAATSTPISGSIPVDQKPETPSSASSTSTIANAFSTFKSAGTGLKPGDSVVVPFGQTLGAIADKFQVPDTTHAQRMVAIFKSNPDEFVQHNMHHMKMGITLVLPDANKVRAMTTDTAERFIDEQRQAYRASMLAPEVLHQCPPGSIRP